MAELARGTVFDRPWGRTLGSLGLRGLSGELTLIADGKTYAIAFANGAVVGAMSPLASDSAVRVALTGGLVSTTQVADLARRQAASDGDEVDVIAAHLRLDYDQAMRLRRRTIAQRAARTFAIEKGDFVVTDTCSLPVVAGSELDVRAIIFLGARQNLSEARLASELGRFGTWFRLKPEAFEDLPQFGFTDQERPIIDQLMAGASLADLETIIGTDPRTVRATLYALCAANACNVEQTRGGGTTKPPELKPGSNPPPQRQAAATAPPRPNRPTAQPIVAYRPGARRRLSEVPSNVVAANPPANRVGRSSVPATAAEPRSSRASTPVTPPPSRTSTPVTPPPSRTSTPATGMPLRAHPAAAPLSKSPSTPPPSRPRAPTPLPDTTLRTTPRSGSSRISGRSGSHTAIPAAVSGRRKATTAQAMEVQQLISARAALIDKRADHYTLLELDPGASPDQIRKIYFALARQLHPDRLASLGIADDAHVAHKVFAQLNTAFSVLSDPHRRAAYDELLGRGGEEALSAEQECAEEIALRVLQSEEIYKRATHALRNNDLATAIAEVKQAIALNPDEPDFAALLAWAQFCAAPDKHAVARETRAMLERAIERSPRAIDPRFFLGRVERMLGRDEIALEMFRNILIVKPSHHEAQSEVRAIEARRAPKGGGGMFGRKR